ncbi:nucleotide pyrophosphohydrolase [Acidovorax sp. SUPP1855]|uniref:nucleotide pyrophosphohydrolase n=1 Tax=Acidovorax sp. SUPP1855 TaxID=431774 RepID=UPI0023DE6474|nr:nucleotide pyrophosphohydrolase [Acidovorax sp. SUPP1855]
MDARLQLHSIQSGFILATSTLDTRLYQTMTSRRMPDSLTELAQQLDQFAMERDWKQFHSPKNLASALVVEAGELLEHFQWITEAQSRELTPAKLDAVGAELSDVLLYLIQLSTALGIDPIAAAQAKLQLNALKYPIDRAHGTSKKYNEL